VKRWVQILCFLISGVLLLVLPSAAQVAVGDDVKLGLSGEISSGYSGTFGTNESTHSLNFGGSGTLHGYYYSPQFLSFDVMPFYNRSQANSAFQSINDSSGLTGSASIFGGSHFPGSISFGKTYDTLGQFGVPGVTGLSTDASGSSLEINWAALFPNRPTLNVSYLLGGQDASVYGSDSRTHLHTRTLNVHSDYTLDGFLLTAFFIHQNVNSSFPALVDLAGGPLSSTEQQGSNSSIGLIASHKIPLKGYWSANVSHNGYHSDTGSNQYSSNSDGSSNMLSTTASIQPIRNLGISMGITYQSNLLGALQQQLFQAGANPALVSTDQSSKAVIMRADSYYQLTSHFAVNGQWNHTQQYFDGRSIGVSQYGGGVTTNYSNHLFGVLTFSLGAVDTATQEGNSGAGMYGNIGYSRRFFGWETNADFNYAQQVQTLGYIYTTSVYGYGGAVRKKFGNKLYWTNTARASHSGLAQQEGTASHSNSFSSTLSYHGASATGVYSQSGGTSILTSQGLVPIPGGIPTPLIITPVLYNAKSYGGGITATVKRFSLNGSYSKAISETTAASFANNNTTIWNALFRCRTRKLYLDAGYTRFGQNVTINGAPPSMLNSYYFGISRWFNVF